jgi:hypothetical protein
VLAVFAGYIRRVKINSESFAYWLQGYFELSPHGGLTPEQVKVIKDHLALVFEKKTPAITINPPTLQPFDIDNTPICCSAPKIDFDGREADISPPVYGEKAYENLFPPTYGIGYTNGSLEPHELKSMGYDKDIENPLQKAQYPDGKPPASC